MAKASEPSKIRLKICLAVAGCFWLLLTLMAKNEGNVQRLVRWHPAHIDDESTSNTEHAPPFGSHRM
jgi:hypothetical protein